MAKSSRRYKRVSCHKTKAAAKAAAKKMRAQGKTAQVRDKCVYSAGNRK